MIYEEYLDLNRSSLVAELTKYVQGHPEYVDSVDNAQLVVTYLMTNSLPITAANVEMAVRAHVKAAAEHPEYGWKFQWTAEDLKAQKTAEGISEVELQIMENWLNKQEPGLDKSLKSKTALLEQMRGRAFNPSNLQDALSRCIFNGRIPAVYISNRQPGIHSDNPKLQQYFTPENERLDDHGRPIKKGWTPSPAAQAAAEREAEEAARRPEVKGEEWWKNRLEVLQNSANTHSRRGELRAMLITKPNGQIDYPATCAWLEHQTSSEVQGSR